MFSGYNGRLSAADPKLLALDLHRSVDFDKDSVAEGYALRPMYVMSPDGVHMAVGSQYYGRLRVIDLRSMRVVEKFTLTNGLQRAEPVMLAWPSPNRIIATAQRYWTHEAYPGELLVIDLRHRTARRTPLYGAVLASSTVDRRRTVLLVASVNHIGPAWLVLVDGKGRMTRVPLPTIDGGYDGRSTSVSDNPALLVRGDVAYVLGPDDHVATVDLRTRVASSGVVTGWPAAQPNPHSFTPGSGGELDYGYLAMTAAGPHRMLLRDFEMHPTAAGLNQGYHRMGALVDTQSWHVTRLFPGAVASFVGHGLLYVGMNHAPDPDQTGPAELAAFDPDGRVVFTRWVKHGSWEMSRGRVIERNSPGGPYELNPLTGRPLRRLGRIAYPFQLIHWRSRR